MATSKPENRSVAGKVYQQARLTAEQARRRPEPTSAILEGIGAASEIGLCNRIAVLHFRHKLTPYLIASRIRSVSGLTITTAGVEKRIAAMRSEEPAVSKEAAKTTASNVSKDSGLAPRSEMPSTIFAPGSIWNADRVALLRRLWVDEGRSLSEIAELLTRDANRTVSRNAVVGKVRDLGLVGMGGSRRVKACAPPVNKAVGLAKKAKPRQRVSVADEAKKQGCESTVKWLGKNGNAASGLGCESTAKEIAPGTHRLTTLDEGRCRFECTDSTDPAKMRFCGEPADPNDRHQVWCVAHRKRVFEPGRVAGGVRERDLGWGGRR